MGKVCELCQKQNAEEKIEGVHVCRNCAVSVKRMFLDDMNATRTLANITNYPNASENAIKNIINIARIRLKQNPIGLDSSERIGQYSNGVKSEEEALEILGYRKKNEESKSTNPSTASGEKRSSYTTQYGSNPTAFNESKRKMVLDNLKYQKVLSTVEKREWIEKYIGIKKFVAGIYTVIGLVVGILVAYLFQFGGGGYILCILLGCGIASALGTNAVGTAMMEAITAEQSIITEELLTELLNNSLEE